MRTLLRRSAARRSLLGRLAPVAFVLTTLLTLAAVPASAATAPDAHLAAAFVTFTTNDDDKDFDTLVRVNVEDPFGRIAADFTDFGTQYVDNTVHGPFSMHPDTGVVAAALNTGRVRVQIVPNGHDTWRFGYELTLFFTDGTSFVIRAANLSLSESSTQLTTPFVLTTQVAVPGLVGRSEASARSALQAAGLTVGSVRHVVDPSCNFLNEVSSQNPDAGTIVNVGTAVSFTIGDRPSTPCP